MYRTTYYSYRLPYYPKRLFEGDSDLCKSLKQNKTKISNPLHLFLFPIVSQNQRLARFKRKKFRLPRNHIKH
jgi:hypothetical protein